MADTEVIPDWRRLFDHLNVHWIDHGHNVGRDEIAIRCPWCGTADHSQHLAISTRKLVYSCRRNREHASGHRGGAIKLLLQLGVPRHDIDKLLDDYPSHTQYVSVPTGLTQTEVSRQWAQFSPAVESPTAMEYLRTQRGFPNAEIVAQRYDLKVSRMGDWAGRLLFPLLNEDGTIASWTGRAVMPHIEPRYRVRDVTEQRGLIYWGRVPRMIGIVVEGPMDALKINAATEHMPVSAAALTGLALSGWASASPERLMRVRNFLRACAIRLIALDASVDISEVNRIARTLAEFSGPGYFIYRIDMPPQFTDPGAMSYAAIREWITTYCDNKGLTNDRAPPANKYTPRRKRG